MIRNFFVLSPRGDTILAKQYRSERGGREMGAHERSHTEALFRKIKFWDDTTMVAMDGDASAGQENIITTAAMDDEIGGQKTSQVMNGGEGGDGGKKKRTIGDAPPVLLMPDGFTYFHIKRNGLIFGASTARNVSPNTVLEVRQRIVLMNKELDNEWNRSCSLVVVVVPGGCIT